MRYKVLGLTIESDTSFAGLEVCSKDGICTPSVTLRQVPFTNSIDPEKWRLIRRVIADPRGKFWSLYQGESAYLLEYDGLVQYSISHDGDFVEYSLNRDNLDQFFQWAFLHLALLFVLHLKSVPVYHASSVSIDGEALVFFGHSGQGKSTLSASFGKAGYLVITDDVLVLKETQHSFKAVPGFPWIRMCRESIDVVFNKKTLDSLSADSDGKLRVSPHSGLVNFAGQPNPVRDIYVLGNGDALSAGKLIEISPMPRAQAVGVLLGRDSLLPILSREQIAHLMAFLTRLVAKVPVWELQIAPGLEQLPQVVEAIVDYEARPLSLTATSPQGLR